jgi:radical SAM superfamily enzyme YgiQ (UPF0313 family)
LSLPSLSAYLTGHGIDVVQKDFNIEAYNLLLSEHNLKLVAGRLKKKFEGLDSKSQLKPGMEQRYYCGLFKAMSNADYLAEKVEDAKNALRDGKFYDLDVLNSAKNVLNQAQDVIALDCFPSGGDLIWPNNTLFKRTFEDINLLTQNRAENPFVDLYKQHLLPFISREDPDVIGISITGERQLIPALTLSRMIKQHHSKIHVVVGGYVISALADTLPRHEEFFTSFFDSAVLYEGERPLLKLVQCISGGQSLNSVPNLIYRNEGKICANEVLEPEDIDLLPTPCFDGLPLNSYLSPEPVLPILSSRGCYWGKCAFCSHNESYQLKYRQRDAGLVVDDMQELSGKYGVAHFAFSDEAISPGSMSKLADEIIRRHMQVRCSTNVRLERSFTTELCNKMFKAGFRLLFLGLESGCNRVLAHMEKGITRETASDVCKNTSQAGIWNHLYVFFGFPTETQAEAQQTVDFLLANMEFIHSFGITNFILNKGTAALRHPEKYGISGVVRGPGTEFTLDYAYDVSSGLTYIEAKELSDLQRERIGRKYEHKGPLNLYYEDLLLYLSHFENSDPRLTSLKGEKPAEAHSVCQITRESVPGIAPHVILRKIQFNIIDIITQNIIKNRTASPEQKYVIFNPVSGKLIPLESLDVEILARCDGTESIKQTASKLCEKYPAASNSMEDDCLESLRYLSVEGYVDIL